MKAQQGNTKSLIDRFLVSDNLMRYVTQNRAIEGDNVSDHSYVTIVINVPSVTLRSISSDCKPWVGIAWNKTSCIKI